MLYQPKPDEWPDDDRDAAKADIISGLEQIMELDISKSFNTPVDLDVYPGYATVVEYPIDLSTIKARFENNFYRRLEASRFDIQYLARNAKIFNEPHSEIIKHARIVRDMCLAVIE